MSNEPSKMDSSPSDGQSHIKPATPPELAKYLTDTVNNLAPGDAPSAQSLSQWVGSLQRSGDMNEIGTALSNTNAANVVRDKDGHVTELIFDHTGGKPVDIKIGSGGDVSINGRDENQLKADDTAYMKRYIAEDVKNDISLSAAGKENVTKLENAMLDGNGQALIEGLKAIQDKPELASEVAQRLNQDLFPAVDVQYQSGKDGAGSFSIKSRGSQETSTVIAADGSVSSSSLNFDGQITGSVDPVRTLSMIGKDFNESKSYQIESDPNLFIHIVCQAKI